VCFAIRFLGNCHSLCRFQNKSLNLIVLPNHLSFARCQRGTMPSANEPTRPERRIGSLPFPLWCFALEWRSNLPAEMAQAPPIASVSFPKPAPQLPVSVNDRQTVWALWRQEREAVPAKSHAGAQSGRGMQPPERTKVYPTPSHEHKCPELEHVERRPDPARHREFGGGKSRGS
jgi:hypothetical protein